MSDSGRSPPRKPGSRGTSPARSSASGQGGANPTGWGPSLGFDPAKPQQEKFKNTRMELPPDAYANDAQRDMFTLRGNKFNTEGKQDMVQVNQYRMTKFDFNKKIYQYDVAISPYPEKIGPVMRKIWAHNGLKNALQQYNYPMWISDMKALAWAPVLVDRGEIRVTVDLDEEQRASGRAPRANAVFHVTLRKTTEIQIAVLQAYLDRKTGFSNSVQEALNFMDHLIRQWPSQHLLAIKRNFYKRSGAGARPLMDGACIEVHKGTYASLRLSHNLGRGGLGLALNADVANTCFWTGGQSFDVLICNFLANCDRRWRGLTPATVSQALKPMRAEDGQYRSTDAFKQIRKLRGLRFKVRHRNRAESDKIFAIDDICFSEKYGPDGATARNVTFDFNGRQVSVADYYQNKYQAPLRYGNLPLIQAGKNGYIPMEFAFLEPMQRYNFKLTPDQTAAMIKIAVTRPQQRKSDIERNVADLQIPRDPFLRHYGVTFESEFTKTEARILPPPQVNFRQGAADPKFSGRWDLRGKKFWKENSAPLSSWGFIVMDNCVNLPSLTQFASSFKTTFMGHGGVCKGDAVLLNVPGQIRSNPGQAVMWAHEQLTAKRGYTQLLFIVVKERNSPHYERLKKSADCRFGILSQVVHAQAVMSNNGQYHSNVCMKVNAKLGGATSRTLPPWKISPQSTYFPKDRPTMMIGVDISHPAPGGVTPSFAAMTMSVDPDATRYAAMVETNGYRQEMLTPSNVHFMFNQLCTQWRVAHGTFPKHIIYMRDGVAEGQFAHVMDQEIGEIKRCLSTSAPNAALPKFTVIVATKRHHIRIFPQKGDKNGNALPGTLLEREVTHPFMFDFYLNSHVAIQGTARPVHYHVILDEMGVPVNELQKMIYHQCYSYARSTTPVSLHPAVYYAHLASNRCRAHENIASSEGHRTGGKGHELLRDQIAKGKTMGAPARGADAPPLLPLGGKPDDKGPVENEMRQRNFFRGTMWFI